MEKDDAAKAESLRQKVAAALNTPLTENGVNPAVLCQNLSEKDKELQKFAADLKISTGKAALIQEITRLDPAIDAKSLAAMTVNDLSLILASRRSGDVAVSQTGTASSKGYISERDAANAAFRHAGIAPGSASYCEVEFDSENGVMVYEVEFLSGGIEYEYEIDASTGAVLYSMQEPEDDDADDAYDDADDAYDDADDAHDDADDADDDANDADDDADDAYDDADDAYDDADDAHDDADDADDDANDADDDADDALIAENTSNLVNAVKSTNNQALQMQLQRNPQVHIDIKGIVMGNERTGSSTACNPVKNGRLYLQISLAVEEIADFRNDLGTFNINFLHIRIHSRADRGIRPCP